MKRARERGFTLVEIMIVTAIIGLLAAIAIPNLLRARVNSNEHAMKKDMRSFSSGNESYRAAQNPPAYAPTLAALTSGALGPPYLDQTWSAAGSRKHGFNFTYTPAAAPSLTYSLLSVPVTAGATALNTYCVDQTGVIVGSTVDGTANVPTGGAAGCAGGVAIL